MRHEEGSFEGYGGLALYRQSWRMVEDTRAAVALIHGYGEHSGRYGNLISHLAGLGYVIHAFDHRGHGRSPGQRGHIHAWDEYREDVECFLSEIATWDGEKPIFLLGHSMGGLIVLEYAMRAPNRLRGIVVSGPPIEPVGVAKPYMVFLAKILTRIYPSFSLSLGFDAPALSRDPAVVKAYQEDPLVHCQASVRWGTESMATIEWVKAHIAELRVPILLLHGGADRVSAAKGSRSLFDAMTVTDKELRVYPGVFHEPHNDLDYEQVCEDVAKWLGKH